MKIKNKLCPTCKTGRESLLLDETSLECPYISRYTGEICPAYVPDEVKEPERREGAKGFFAFLRKNKNRKKNF